MTRKDFQLIALALKKCKSLGHENQYYVADMLAYQIKLEYPRFDRDRFMQACGFGVRLDNGTYLDDPQGLLN